MIGRRYLPLCRLEARKLRSHKVLLLIIIAQLFMFGALTTLTAQLSEAYAGVSSFSSPRILIASEGEAANWLATSLRSNGIFVVQSASPLILSRIDAIITVSKTTLRGNEPIAVTVELKESPSAPVFIRYIQKSLLNLEEEARMVRGAYSDINPPKTIELNVWTAREALSSQYYFEMTYALLLPIILLVPTLISGGFVMDSIFEDREKKTVSLLASSPVTLQGIFLVKMFTHLMIGVGQSIFWMVVLKLNSVVISGWVGVMVVVVLLNALYVTFGAFLCTSLPTKLQGQLWYSVASTILIVFWLSTQSPLSVIVDQAVGNVNQSMLSTLSIIPIIIVMQYFIYRYCRTERELLYF